MALRVGIVGWGDIARIHALKIEAAGAQVCAVVSRKKKLDCGVPVYGSFDDMIAHVDAITIAVPNFLHAEFCLKAARAGKAVMVEKPLCITKDELYELDRVLTKVKIPMHVGYRLRWNPTAIKLRESIKRVQKISCMYNLDMNLLADGKGWTTRFKQTGGSFFTLGIHSLDLARWLAGARGEALTSFCARAEGIESPCDFPLHVQLAGKLPSGIEIIAGADHRKGTPYSVEIKIETDEGAYPDTFLPPPQVKDGGIEYESLFQNFIKAAEENIWDENEHNEVIQTHRELLEGQKIVNNPLSKDCKQS